ncbi:MAG: DUF6624 domain-containing protein [Nanoarchaeota archaeon]
MKKELRKELLEMFKADQKAAVPFDPIFNEIIVKNKKRLDEIIKKFGWPSSNLVGKKGEMAAWLIVQHADFDVKFQEKCLKFLLKLPKTKEREKHIAYLTDRTLVNRRRKQIYGTQFYPNKSGILTPRPIRDIHNIERKRAEVGLESFKTYKKRMEKK